MNYERLDTGSVVAAGILRRPMPKTSIPRERDEFNVDAYEQEWTKPGLTDALNSGLLLQCCEYYGIAYAWKDESVYRGTLLQYREVTEDPIFDSAEKCVEWFTDLLPRITG